MQDSARMNDDVRWKRLRWRCRRGMLENDIVLTRWLDAVEACGGGLREDEIDALDRLLDLPATAGAPSRAESSR
jgi:antitoxin CptB